MGILDELKYNIPTRFANMNPHHFKELICELFNDSGYQVKTAKSMDDFGANILLTKDNLETAVQIKKYKRGNLVDVEEINEVLGRRESYEFDKVLIITTSDFTEPAKKLAGQRGVELWNWDKLHSEIRKIYFAPKSCIEAIKRELALDSLDSPKRIEAFEKAVSLALTKEGRKEIYEDMINSGPIVDSYRKAVNDKIVGLMTHLARLYEDAYRFSKAEKILEQALRRNEGSYGAIKAMSDILLKEGKIEEAIELWKEKTRKGLTADTRWLRDAERRKREGYCYHPKPETVDELETLINEKIIPKGQCHYRKENIMEKQQRRKLKKTTALDAKKKEVEVEALCKRYCIRDISALHKDCFVRLGELVRMLFYEDFDKYRIRNEMKLLLELHRDNGSFRYYGLDALRLSYFVERKKFSQHRIRELLGSPVPLLSPLFFSNCGLGHKWGREVPQELKRYLHGFVDRYRRDVRFCDYVLNRLAETHHASGKYEKALVAIKSMSRPEIGSIEIAIEIRYKLNESLEGHELLAAAGINNGYYSYADGKKRTRTVEIHAGKGDWIEVENPAKAEITYHFTDFTVEHFDAIAARCEKKLRKWERDQGQGLLQHIAGIYDEDPSFTSSGHNLMFAKEFIELVAKIAYEAENEIRDEMDYPPIGKPSLTETKLYQLVKSVFKGYEVIRHAKPSFLGRQHLDIYIPELRLAIEYQGEQHFKPIDFWGGVEGLKASQERDENKGEVCKRHGIAIRYFSYKDEVSSELIQRRLRDYVAS